MQDMLQRRVVAAALAGRPARLPWPGRVMMRLPLARWFAARVTAFGVRRVRVSSELATSTASAGREVPVTVDDRQ
jgi:hypothetical protein